MDKSTDRLFIKNGLIIPLRELNFSFERSRGPGGQHVNRSHTAVVLTFSIEKSETLSATQKIILVERLSNMLSKQGELRLFCDTHRSQWQNKNEVIQRFTELLQQALKTRKKRIPTKPSNAAKKKRLDAKKHQSKTKKARKPVRPIDEE